MAAAITDLLTQATTNSRPSPTQVSSVRAAAGTTLQCLALTGWPTNTAVHFITYKINTSGAKIAGSQIDWKGIVSGTTITNLTVKAGTDVGSAIGDIVEAAPTAAWANDVVTWGTAQHDQFGAHTAVTATSLITTGAITEGGTPLASVRTETTFDFVASGGVWSGDAYASTRNASMTALVCYINGQRGTVSAVTARSFTASKDTYIDVLNTAGVFTLVYTEVANNAASPALAANSIRIGIIVTGASNIAAAGSVNQGQENMVLPIASSVPYAVTDSLGNLICPRDPQRKILGYRQITSTFSATGTSINAVTGLSVPVIIPSGRKIKVVAYASNIANNPSSGYVTTTVWDGTVGSGTQVGAAQTFIDTGGGSASQILQAITTPSATSKTYNVGLQTTVVTGRMDAAATSPSYIRVELA